MWMASAGCQLIQRHKKMCSYTFAILKTRKKRGNSCKSSTPPLTSEGRHYGSSSATAMTSNPVAAFALKSRRAVPSVRWVAIMATVRRRRRPFSPEGHGTRSQLTLWGLSPPTTDKSSSPCFWTAIRGIPSSSPLATTPQTR